MTVLVVAGFHRSGTSMATEILHRAGLHVGDELIGAGPTNPYGHFEDHEIVRLHDRLLADAGMTWQVDEPFTPVIGPARFRQMAGIVDRRQARHRVWGFKDPRNAFYLSAWKYLAPTMKTLVVYRDPRECAWSLERRHLQDAHRRSGPVERHMWFWERPDHALRMWVEYNRAIVDYARAHRDSTLVIPHAAILAGLSPVEAVRRALDVDLAPVDAREVVDPSVTRSRPGRQSVGSTAVVRDVLATWRDLEHLAADDAPRYQETPVAV